MLFTGRITADAAVRVVGETKKVTGFTVAINDSYRDRGGAKKDITTYVECSYWVNPGLAAYLTKGAVVEVVGRIEARVWTNNEAQTQPYLACTVSGIRLFGGTGSANNGGDGTAVKGAGTETAADTVINAGVATGNSSNDKDLPLLTPAP